MVQEQKRKNKSAIVLLLIGEIFLIPLYFVFGVDYRWMWWVIAIVYSLFVVFCVIAVIIYDKSHKFNGKKENK